MHRHNKCTMYISQPGVSSIVILDTAQVLEARASRTSRGFVLIGILDFQFGICNFAISP